MHHFLISFIEILFKKQLQIAVKTAIHQNVKNQPLVSRDQTLSHRFTIEGSRPISFIRAQQSLDYSDISESENEDIQEPRSVGSLNKPNECKNQTTPRKRNAETALNDGSASKRSCDNTDFGTVSELMKSSIEQGLQFLKQENDDYVEQIGCLQANLNKITDEKTALEQKNAGLIDEKEALEKLVANSEKAKRNQKEMFDDAKKKFMENIAALEETNRNEKKNYDDEKKVLEDKIAVLEQNKAKAMCTYCQKVFETVHFCNNEC